VSGRIEATPESVGAWIVEEFGICEEWAMTSDSLEGTIKSGGTYHKGYFDTRFADDPNRLRVWVHICRYLRRWIGPNDAVLDLGAGRCDFANNVVAGSVTALDVDDTVLSSARPGVKAIVGDCTDLSAFNDDDLDVVLASNLLEHLDRTTALRLLGEARRVLRPGGRLILLQPNFRLSPGGYFDDYTHVAIYTDRSLRDLLIAEGWTVSYVAKRFLPLSMNSRGSRLTFLVPWYLRSPVKPFAGQMLLVAVS
jgi:SAM-dependent methyltransferase